MKQYFIKICLDADKQVGEFDCLEGESVLEAITRQGILSRSDCGGRGTCGKCRIQVISGDIAITLQDRRIFTESQLLQGFRLACRAYPGNDCEIRLGNVDDANYSVVSDIIVRQSDNRKDFIIGIDIGTTTLAISLVNAGSGKVIHSYSAINGQRVYGADVISRINASNEGKKEQLAAVIRKNLYTGILTVIQESGVDINRITAAAISGNTSMGHLLMGYSCETLGVYPFVPVNLERTEVSFKELFLSGDSDNPVLEKLPIILLPGISTFVGADIAAGLLTCGFAGTDKICMLIDLGTNGEMAIGNKERVLVTSTAAGPAFEGVNISCGTGSIPGAISHVEIVDNHVTYRTIGGNPAIGICGTGVIELVSELLDSGYMDATGLLEEKYFESGFELPGTGVTGEAGPDHKIIFTQRDIRELQLAKAAVRTGIEILVKNYGVSYDEIDTVYLAGGFGFHLEVAKAVNIGLLPEQLRSKIRIVGNSSLSGAIEYLIAEDAKRMVEDIRSVSREIHLSNDDDFNELYLKYMSFDNV